MAPKTEFFDLPSSAGGEGCRMAYRLYNPTPSSSSSNKVVPLVLINGLSAVMEDWSPLVESLSASRPVLISDHRGIGSSTVDEEVWDHNLTLESMGMDVMHLCSFLGFPVVDLLGFSMGGHIVQALISSPSLAQPADPKEGEGGVVIKVNEENPSSSVRVRKVILTATMTKLPRGDLDLMALQTEAEKIKDREERNKFVTQEMMKMQYHPAVLGFGGELQSKMENRTSIALRTSRPAKIIGLQFMAIQSADLRDQLSNVPKSLPVMIIHGHKDRMVKYDESNHITQGIKHAKRLSNTPSNDFAHFWYDYFNTTFWTESITNFLDHGVVGGIDDKAGAGHKAKL